MKIGIEEHALLYGLLVRNACAELGEEEGKAVMAEATKHYGRCRGKRMKESALRLGYGESHPSLWHLPRKKDEEKCPAAWLW